MKSAKLKFGSPPSTPPSTHDLTPTTPPPPHTHTHKRDEELINADRYACILFACTRSPDGLKSGKEEYGQGLPAALLSKICPTHRQVSILRHENRNSPSGKLVSNWTITSRQPHRVTSGQSNSAADFKTPIIYKPFLKSVHKANPNANRKHTCMHQHHPHC